MQSEDARLSKPARPVRLVVGANRGIGLALTAAQLADAEVEMLVATHRGSADLSALRALDQRWPGKLEMFELDVCRSADHLRLVDFLADLTNGVDLAIHAAGILHDGDLQPEKALASCDADHLMRLFQINSIGPLMTAKALMPSQPRKKPFVFAALSAMVGSIGDNRLGGWYGYRASKAALNQFLRTLSNECRFSHPNAAVVALHPGTTDTGLSRPFQQRIESDKLYDVEQTADRLLNVLGGLSSADSGQFYNWNGSNIPW
ncbi:MAG: SDR family NAD(P)-dependent oxidoreductase [Xanthomonadales bacterium]|nr:SDR family NAD(P)-dependent oxidoreductase [Gammaproteobacteria bacterium]MBT8049658.1 SDR family NAD(P)-dependent oxidoreductase [Gammaproteobacteria bacterium]MBT8055774.1 SDR family NAD(P)-dependent oxidoreductase [Gammaproteobacteria bacterium]NNJ78988.1 SDR family NAD(P)-dependent oxidoreductase [Xanthomonadales bacterium]NNL05169.1 SDR family NAD(P)-dependent oxidoreductase [Xanthomonadales bacterium]